MVILGPGWLKWDRKANAGLLIEKIKSDKGSCSGTEKKNHCLTDGMVA